MSHLSSSSAFISSCPQSINVRQWLCSVVAAWAEFKSAAFHVFIVTVLLLHPKRLTSIFFYSVWFQAELSINLWAWLMLFKSCGSISRWASIALTCCSCSNHGSPEIPPTRPNMVVVFFGFRLGDLEATECLLAHGWRCPSSRVHNSQALTFCKHTQR